MHLYRPFTWIGSDFVCVCSTDVEEQLAARIAVSDLHKSTKKSFSET